MPHKKGHLIANPFAPDHHFLPCSKSYLATLKHAEAQDKKEQLRQLVEQGLAKTGAPGSTKADLVKYCKSHPTYKHKPMSPEEKAERSANRQAYAALRKAEKSQFTPEQFEDIYRPNPQTGQCPPYPLDFKLQYKGKEVDFPDFTHERTKKVRRWEPKKLSYADYCVAPVRGPGWLADVLVKSFGFVPKVQLHRDADSHVKKALPQDITVDHDIGVSVDEDTAHVTDLQGEIPSTEVPLPADEAENLIPAERGPAVRASLESHAEQMRQRIRGLEGAKRTHPTGRQTFLRKKPVFRGSRPAALKKL